MKPKLFIYIDYLIWKTFQSFNSNQRILFHQISLLILFLCPWSFNHVNPFRNFRSELYLLNTWRLSVDDECAALRFRLYYCTESGNMTKPNYAELKFLPITGVIPESDKKIKKYLQSFHLYKPVLNQSKQAKIFWMSYTWINSQHLLS